MLESRETELIKAIIDNLDDSETEYTKTPQSRNEEILVSILNETEYTKTPQSREEELLLELKEKIGGLVPPVPPVIKRVTGNPIEFENGADAPLVKCTTAIQGNQDLHGYDKPWVGGSGKNKFPIETITRVADPAITTNIDGSYTISGSATGYVQAIEDGSFTLPADTYTFSVFGEAVTNAVAQIRSTDGQTTYVSILYGNSATFTLNESTELKFRFTFNECTVNQTVYVQIESGSQSTSYAPYSNICPITAYTENTIWGGGKNLVFEVLTGVNISGQGELVSLAGFSLGVASVTRGITYTVTTDEPTFVGGFFTSIPSLGSITYNGNREIGVKTFTAPITGYVVIRASESYQYHQCEKGQTATSYEEKMTTHTATFSNSIYQGNADFVGGSATTQKIKWTAKWGDVEGKSLGDYTRKRFALSSDKYSVNNDPNAISNLAPMLANYSSDSLHFYCGGDAIYYYMPNDTDADTELEVVYELASPTTETITPTNLPIKSLFGYNHIESSTGDMTIDYITEGYQNFVDTVESALPNTTRNLLTASKGGTKAMDIFLSLENWDAKEEVKEEDGEDKKEVDEIQNGVKEEIMDDR